MTADKPAYILVDTKITDPVAYEDYKAAAKPIAEQYGGVYLTRGGKMDLMQTELWDPTRIVLVKFPSMTAAHAFLDSPPNMRRSNQSGWQIPRQHCWFLRAFNLSMPSL